MLGRLKKAWEEKTRETPSKDRGLLIFSSTSEVIRAERVLKKAGYRIRVVGPPPEIRHGCDLAIEFPLMEQLEVLRVLRDNRLEPIMAQPVNSPLLEPVSLFRSKDFGRYIMVRAANMKITLDKETFTIVNVSGGGCPDVPYLSNQLIGKDLREAPEPKELGHTLCGYALQLAFLELKRLCLG